MTALPVLAALALLIAAIVIARRSMRPKRPPAPPASPYIFRDQLGINAGADPTVLTWLASMELRHIRTTCYWANMLDPRSFIDGGGIGPEGRTPSQRFYHDFAKYAGTRFRVLLLFHTAPANDQYGDGLPQFIAEVIRACEAIAPGVLEAIQIGNECNPPGDEYWPRLHGTTQEERGASYAQLVHRCAVEVRATAPHLQLVTAGMVGDPRPFLRGMFRQLEEYGPVDVDAVSCHCYGVPAHQFRETSTQALEVLNELTLGTEIWVTEIGSEFGRFGNDAVQLADMKAVFNEFQTGPRRVSRWYWYTSYDGTFDNALLRPDYTERPAAAYFRERVQSAHITPDDA